MRTVSFGLSDVGRRRPHNEDSFLCDDELQLYVVADGVGGRAKGEVASQEAVEQLQIWILRHEELLRDTARRTLKKRRPELRRMLESGIQAACYMVHGMAELEPDKRGMSTTLSALLVVGELALVGQVGDTRVYHYRKGKAFQLTEDHTLINYKLKKGLITPEEAARARGKNIITRAVGHKDYVQVDVIDLWVKPGDRFMLCSDGLHGYFLPGEEHLAMEGPLEERARVLVDLANARGGKDNITVVLVDVVE